MSTQQNRSTATATKPQQQPLDQGPRAAAPLTRVDPANDLKKFLLSNTARIREVAAKHLNPDRIVRLTTMAIHKDKSGNLQRCTPISILQALMESARLGLEIGGALGHAYLVPYKNRDLNLYEAQFQIGYRGMIELAMRSEKIASVQAHVVYEKDFFTYELGDSPFIKHKPSLEDDRGKWTHVYSVVRIRGEVWRNGDGDAVRETGGGVLLDVMTRGQVMKVKARSPGAKLTASPWNNPNDETEMARKTVVRRNLKYAPMSEQLAEALDHENEIEGEVLSRDEQPAEEPRGVEGMKRIAEGKAAQKAAPAGEEPPPHGEEPATREPGDDGDGPPDDDDTNEQLVDANGKPL